MRIKETERPILLAFAVPYGFLAMYFDVQRNDPSVYVFFLLVVIALGIWIRRSKCSGILLMGNGLAAVCTCLLTALFQTERWSFYFKPFSPFTFALLIHLLSLMAQYVIVHWGRKRNTSQNFLMALSIAALLAGAVVYGFLYRAAAGIGAI